MLKQFVGGGDYRLSMAASCVAIDCIFRSSLAAHAEFADGTPGGRKHQGLYVIVASKMLIGSPKGYLRIWNNTSFPNKCTHEMRSAEQCTLHRNTRVQNN